MNDISRALAMSWGGDRNLALRAALSLPPLPEDPEPRHKCWVDAEGVAWYIGRIIGEQRLVGRSGGTKFVHL